MTQATERYRAWVEHPELAQEYREELVGIADDAADIEDRFYQELAFGTAGLRGVMGAGTNRMNPYIVARAAEAFARVIECRGESAKAQGMAISYDSRLGSAEFARLVAGIFARHGIKVRLSDELRPVPLLSFAIRHYQCAGGVMITASHNPKIYNGFKAYGPDGGQLDVAGSDRIAAEIATITDPIHFYHSLPPVETMLESSYIEAMGTELDQAYDRVALSQCLNPAAVKAEADLAIVYTPLNGTGNKPVRRLLKRVGFTNISVVKEQEEPNGNFPTTPYPNPEYRETLTLGMALAEERHADLLLATDPDADRLGVAVRNAQGEFVVLSGNQIGCLLMDYILSQKKAKGELSEQSFVVSTVVSSRLPDIICKHYGVKLFRTLTGFKNIAEVMRREGEAKPGEFLFGYEESFGYLVHAQVRDKDAVSAALLMAELAAFCAQDGKTVYDYLLELFHKYEFSQEKTISLVREGKVGQAAIRRAMAQVRADKSGFFAPLEPRQIWDFQTLTVDHPASGTSESLDFAPSNVLVYALAGTDWFACRPSGTEPKLKIYMGCGGPDLETAQHKLDRLEKIVAERIVQVLDQA